MTTPATLRGVFLHGTARQSLITSTPFTYSPRFLFRRILNGSVSRPPITTGRCDVIQIVPAAQVTNIVPTINYKQQQQKQQKCKEYTQHRDSSVKLVRILWGKVVNLKIWIYHLSLDTLGQIIFLPPDTIICVYIYYLSWTEKNGQEGRSCGVYLSALVSDFHHFCVQFCRKVYWWKEFLAINTALSYLLW